MPFEEIQMSYGSELQFSTTAGGSYTAIVGARSISWKGTRPSANVSALADTQIVYKRKRRDTGTLTCEVIYQETQYAVLHALHLAGDERYWKVKDPAGALLGPFFGHIMDFGLEVPDDEALTHQLVIQCSGGGTAADSFTAAP